MDKVFVESGDKKTCVEVPQHGKITLICQDGKVVRLETNISQKLI